MNIRSLLAVIFTLAFSISHASDDDNSLCTEESCVDVGSWEIGLALGLGARSNPLVGGDNLPLVIMPDIAYYGEAFYFDNFEIGYQFLYEDAFSLETFIRPNTERAFFSFWHPDNIFLSIPANAVDTPAPLPGEPGEPSKPVEKPIDREISVDDVAKREWAIDAGLRWQYYHDDFRLGVFYASDVSSVHKGFYAGLNVIVPWSVSNWRFASSFGATYKNKDLINYYYGISARDTDVSTNTYSADGGWQYNFSTSAIYPFSDKWQFLVRVEVTRLHDSMYDSPLVKDKHVTSFFSGMVYRF